MVWAEALSGFFESHIMELALETEELISMSLE